MKSSGSDQLFEMSRAIFHKKSAKTQCIKTIWFRRPEGSERLNAGQFQLLFVFESQKNTNFEKKYMVNKNLPSILIWGNQR